MIVPDDASAFSPFSFHSSASKNKFFYKSKPFYIKTHGRGIMGAIGVWPMPYEGFFVRPGPFCEPIIGIEVFFFGSPRGRTVARRLP